MYERNAIVLERYFNQMFGYNMKKNIKTNFKDYSELVKCLEKYKNISEEEEIIMQEYDSIANKIRDIQKKQEILNKKNKRYQEQREEIFQNIDENADTIQKKLDNLNEDIKDTEEEIKENAQQFVDVVAEFAEKTIVRTNCGKKRRTIENEYNNKLNETLDNYKNIDINIEKKAKQFIEIDTEDIEDELKEQIKKNGEKEKIPFNSDVVTKAIMLSIDMQKRETDILSSIYEKTNKLFTEIKNNTIKNDKHLKSIKDSKCKLEFIGAIKEYLIQFLDNERLTIVNGEEEHDKLMEEACKNLDEDILQINNLYNLLLKEMSKKATRKSYTDLYNLDYLKSLEIKADKFDAEIKKLKLPVTIINPNYWRIEGMKKIYDIFYKCVTEEYGKDLSEYTGEKIEELPKNEPEEIEEKETTKNNKKENNNEPVVDDEENDNEEKNVRAEIDKKIDMILGIEDDESDLEEEIEEEEFEEEEEEWDDEFEDEEEFDEEFEDDWDDKEEIEEDEEWDDEFEDEEDFEEDEDFENDEFEDDDYDEDNEEEDEEWDDEEFEDEDFEDDWDEDEEQEDEEDNNDEQDIIEDEEIEDTKTHIDIWGNSIKEKVKGKQKNKKTEEIKEQSNDDDWENEFVNIKKKKETKKNDKKDGKKRGFLSKFKK